MTRAKTQGGGSGKPKGPPPPPGAKKRARSVAPRATSEWDTDDEVELGDGEPALSALSAPAEPERKSSPQVKRRAPSQGADFDPNDVSAVLRDLNDRSNPRGAVRPTSVTDDQVVDAAIEDAVDALIRPSEPELAEPRTNGPASKPAQPSEPALRPRSSEAARSIESALKPRASDPEAAPSKPRPSEAALKPWASDPEAAPSKPRPSEPALKPRASDPEAAPSKPREPSLSKPRPSEPALAASSKPSEPALKSDEAARSPSSEPALKPSRPSVPAPAGSAVARSVPSEGAPKPTVPVPRTATGPSRPLVFAPAAPVSRPSAPRPSLPSASVSRASAPPVEPRTAPPVETRTPPPAETRSPSSSAEPRSPAPSESRAVEPPVPASPIPLASTGSRVAPLPSGTAPAAAQEPAASEPPAELGPPAPTSRAMSELEVELEISAPEPLRDPEPVRPAARVAPEPPARPSSPTKPPPLPSTAKAETSPLPSKPPAKDEPAAPAAQATVKVQGLRVAIHESATILAATRQAVHGAGHTVALAATGKEGVDRIKAALAGGELPAGITGIDVLLVGVPGGEGAIEAARSLQNRPVTVAACSGNAQEIVKKALEVGADLVTTRPHDDRLAAILFAAGRLAAVRRIAMRAVGPMLSGAAPMPSLPQTLSTPQSPQTPLPGAPMSTPPQALPTLPQALPSQTLMPTPPQALSALPQVLPSQTALPGAPTPPSTTAGSHAVPPTTTLPITDGARSSAAARARSPSDAPSGDGEMVLRARVEALAEQEPGTLQPLDLFERILDLELKRVSRYNYPIAIAMFAVEVEPPPPPGVRGILRARAGNALVNAIRDIDLATELDHERFLVLLPYTSLMGAAEVGRRIIAAVAAGDPVVAGGKAYAPRVIGAVAGSVPGQPLSFARLLKDADRALEQARKDGAELAVPMVRDPRAKKENDRP